VLPPVLEDLFSQMAWEVLVAAFHWQ
jgi:hypothetical protein